MNIDQYLEKHGREDVPLNIRPRKHILEGQTLNFEITNTREVRRSTFMEMLEERGIARLLPVKS